MSVQEEIAGKPTSSRRKLVVGAAAAVVVIGGLGGWKILDTRATNTARAEYASAVEAHSGAREDFQKVLVEAHSASEGCVEHVADPTVCEELSSLLGELDEDVKVEPAGESRSELEEATDKLDVSTKALVKETTALRAAIAAVNASVEAKALTDAKTELDDAVTAAQSQIQASQLLIDSSAYKVADDSTRQVSAVTIGELNTLLSQVGSVSEDLASVEGLAKQITEKTAVLAQNHAAMQASADAWSVDQAQASATSRQVPATSGSRRTGGSTAPARSSSGSPVSRGGGVSSGGSSSSGGSGSTGSGGSGKSSGNNTGGWVESESSECWTVNMDTNGNSVTVPCP